MLQKAGVAASIKPAASEPAGRRPLALRVLTNPAWLCGAALMALGTVVEVQAIGVGPLSIVRPLIRAQALVAIVLGVLFLRERLGRLDVTGALLLVAGTAVVAWQVGETEATSDGSVLILVLLGCISIAFARRFGLTELGLALAIGCTLTAGDLLMRLATQAAGGGDFDLSDSATAARLVTDPRFLGSIALGLLAFLLLQVAYAFGRVSLLSPLTNGAATFATVGAAAVLLGEPVSNIAAVGVALIVLGGGVIALGGLTTRR